MDIDFRVLGPLEVYLDGRPVALGTPKQRKLLSVLLLHANAAVSVDRLSDQIWDEKPPSTPGRSVQVYVSNLRTSLGSHTGVVQTTDQGYRLIAESQQLDARRFEHAAREAKRLLASGQTGPAAVAASTALALWRGSPFDELADSQVARAEIIRLQALRLGTLEDRVEAELAEGRHCDVVAELEGLVDEHPLRERFRFQLMLALHRCARQADALAVYRAGRRLLVDELGMEPGQRLRDLHDAILRDDTDLLVEPAELRERRHLPSPATSLIGRRSRIAEITALLRRSSVRLVTATGPGGIGKTRVCLQAAHELADDFPDGVFFVGLAELRDPRLFVSTLAAAVGLEEVADEPLLATVQERLRHRRLLLLLDNFEHLDDAAPLVSQMLAAAPGLKVLVTSRSRLRLYGEHDYPVPPLGLQDEAVPLFAARAQAADPGFRLTDGLAATVNEICARLDCLPLAIELASARIRELSPQEMLKVLPNRLELAAAGARDLSPRQQTLRATIDWSYRLLARSEQRLFTGLAVFSGGFTEETARHVCGAVPGQLPSLAAKSLVVRRRTEHGDLRFDMMETIREFGQEQLDLGTESGERVSEPAGATVRDEHARFFLSLSEAASGELSGPEQHQWISRLTVERDNMRTALVHLLATASEQQPPGQSLVRLAAALGFFWYKSGSGAEGSLWLERALAAAPHASDQVRGRALHALGIIVAERGDAAAALVHCREGGELLRRAGDLAGVARSLNSQGGIARDVGDFATAERLFAESVDLRRSLGSDQTTLAIVLGNLAMVALDRHDLPRARAVALECLALARESDEWVYAATLALLADIAIEECDVRGAGDLLQHAVPILQRLGATYRLVECLDSCAALSACMGRPEPAARLVGSADAALDELGARMVPADAAMRERRLSEALASLDADAFEAARIRGQKMTVDEALDYAGDEVIRRAVEGSG